MEHKGAPQSEGLSSEKISQVLNEEKPNFKNTFDAVAFVLHAVMKELGFPCIAVHEKWDEKANEKCAAEGWNSSSDSYSFTYKHSKSSMTFAIKSLVMGDKLLVNGLGIEDKKNPQY